MLRMKSYKLSFATINILRNDIAEFIINAGIEVNLTQVREADEFLISHLQAPFSLMFNKLNNYSYSFEAQMKMGDIKQLNAIAIVSYSATSDLSTDALKFAIPRDKEWNLKRFSDKPHALEWLKQEQENLKTGKNH